VWRARKTVSIPMTPTSSTAMMKRKTPPARFAGARLVAEPGAAANVPGAAGRIGRRGSSLAGYASGLGGLAGDEAGQESDHEAGAESDHAPGSELDHDTGRESDCAPGLGPDGGSDHGPLAGSRRGPGPRGWPPLLSGMMRGNPFPVGGGRAPRRQVG
jgi:hypothetical protein